MASPARASRSSPATRRSRSQPRRPCRARCRSRPGSAWLRAARADRCRCGGTAYRAYQPAVGREVAIKVIRADLANDPGFIRRFQAEAQVVATLEHPHIVPLYDYWREPDAAYLVMRLMRGGAWPPSSNAARSPPRRR